MWELELFEFEIWTYEFFFLGGWKTNPKFIWPRASSCEKSFLKQYEVFIKLTPGILHMKHAPLYDAFYSSFREKIPH